MRRSGSSSCLLRPRDSIESSDHGGDDQQQQQQQQQLSVTMISREELPNYSTERFFMLSEFELNSHSIRFISDLQDADENTPETVDTSSLTEELNSCGGDTDAFAPYLLVYLLWRPDETTSVSAFTANVIMQAANRIQSLVDVSLSDEDKKRSQTRDGSMSPSRRFQNDPDTIDTSPSREQEESVANSSQSSLDNGKTRLYLVVDRIVPAYNSPQHENINNDDTEKDNHGDEKDMQQRHFEVETKLAERLARYVAGNSRLRSLFQGITIGIANHKRAAPGLDACLDAINTGARDRRKISRDCKSLIGIISMSSEDLLGLDEEQETDAAQGVLQTRISTEWNGKGNLKSFALRAHAMWRKEYGLPPETSDLLPDAVKQRRTGRRLTPLNEEMNPLDKLPFLDAILNLLNVGAFALVAYYVWTGLFGDIQ